MPESTLTFTAFNDAGTSLGTATVTGIVLYDTDFFDKAMNQYEGITLDGGSIVEGNLVTRSHGVILMAAISLVQGRAFRTWLREKLNFKGNYLGIGLAGAAIDIGKGVGVDIAFADRARFADKDTKGTTKQGAPGLFSLKFNYTFRQ
jgi:hypothetical protein